MANWRWKKAIGRRTKNPCWLRAIASKWWAVKNGSTHRMSEWMKAFTLRSHFASTGTKCDSLNCDALTDALCIWMPTARADANKSITGTYTPCDTHNKTITLSHLTFFWIGRTRTNTQILLLFIIDCCYWVVFLLLPSLIAHYVQIQSVSRFEDKLIRARARSLTHTHTVTVHLQFQLGRPNWMDWHIWRYRIAIIYMQSAV